MVAFSILVCFLGEVVSYLFYSKWPTEVMPSQTCFPTTHKNKKKSKKKDSRTGVFCKFCRIFKNAFLRTSPVAASEDEHDETKILHMTSQLEVIECIFEWFVMICFSVAGQNLKWGKTKRKISFLYSFKEGNVSLENGTIAPNVPPQLCYWYFAKLYFPVPSSLHSSHKI